MAVVHAHTPEFVAFGMSSVPLWNGGSAAPVWDIRQFNKERSGIVNTPELGRAMAATLGRNDGVLLWGHGIAMTGGSIKDAVTRVIELRDTPSSAAAGPRKPCARPCSCQRARQELGGAAVRPRVRADCGVHL